MHSRKEQMEAFGRFLDILDELRVKCPWDRKQTNESLRPNTTSLQASNSSNGKKRYPFSAAACFSLRA
jgi:hypothetical protein